MEKTIKFGKRFFRNEDGATAIEYGLLAALISVAIIGLVSLLGGSIAGAFDEVNDQMVDGDGNAFVED